MNTLHAYGPKHNSQKSDYFASLYLPTVALIESRVSSQSDANSNRIIKQRVSKGKRFFMSEVIISNEPSEIHSNQAAGKPVCPECGRESHDGLIPFASLGDEIKVLVAANTPGGAL